MLFLVFLSYCSSLPPFSLFLWRNEDCLLLSYLHLLGVLGSILQLYPCRLILCLIPLCPLLILVALKCNLVFFLFPSAPFFPFLLLFFAQLLTALRIESITFFHPLLCHLLSSHSHPCFICFPYLSFQDPLIRTKCCFPYLFLVFVSCSLSFTVSIIQLAFLSVFFSSSVLYSSLPPTVAVPRPSACLRPLLITTLSFCHNKTAAALDGAFPRAAFVETMLAVFLPSPRALGGGVYRYNAFNLLPIRPCCFQIFKLLSVFQHPSLIALFSSFHSNQKDITTTDYH